MDVVYDEGKLAELIVYVAARLRAESFAGATKLNKVLFFADFAHVRLHGQPITGAEYQKLEHGPAPRRLLPVRRRLVAEGAIELISEQFLGRTQHRVVAQRVAVLDRFSPTELATIDSVLEDLAGLTGLQVSALSHEEPGWQHTAMHETIPYEFALIPNEQTLTPTAVRLTAEIASKYQLVLTD